MDRLKRAWQCFGRVFERSKRVVGVPGPEPLPDPLDLTEVEEPPSNDELQRLRKHPLDEPDTRATKVHVHRYELAKLMFHVFAGFLLGAALLFLNSDWLNLDIQSLKDAFTAVLTALAALLGAVTTYYFTGGNQDQGSS